MSQFKESNEGDDKPIQVDIKNLSFAYPGRASVLNNLTMQLTAGSRCLLIGANGAGKSTLLRILAGRHLVKPDESVRVLGKSVFHDTSLNFERSYLDTDWGMRTVSFAGYGCPLQADIAVRDMMKKLQSEYPERRDELLQLLRIDPEWRMHQVSDGQRRRVQIFIGLLRPFKILFLDEVTVSLDVIVRQDLLQWLREESIRRQATIIYATHIFDGLDDWPTHLHYLTNKGNTGWQGKLYDLEYYQELRKIGHPSPLLKIAERWLRQELVDSKNALEEASGVAAQAAKDPLQVSNNAGGGFSNGRMAAYDFISQI
mmetsp:Transcript_10734/g.11578  ORF Transcript_10734/g.11578 Transcript_10734/m.11578 type:complete len:314 (-) Transcript_10734:185-1126(-)|eukprot:gene9518-10334_t